MGFFLFQLLSAREKQKLTSAFSLLDKDNFSERFEWRGGRGQAATMY